jgi:hypothetical protein
LVLAVAPLNPKLKPLSTKIAEAKFAADITIIGAIILGMIENDPEVPKTQCSCSSYILHSF